MKGLCGCIHPNLCTIILLIFTNCCSYLLLKYKLKLFNFLKSENVGTQCHLTNIAWIWYTLTRLGPLYWHMTYLLRLMPYLYWSADIWVSCTVSTRTQDRIKTAPPPPHATSVTGGQGPTNAFRLSVHQSVQIPSITQISDRSFFFYTTRAYLPYLSQVWLWVTLNRFQGYSGQNE